MCLYEQNPLKGSHHPAKFCSHRHYGCADTVILFFSLDLERSHDQMVIRPYEEDFLMLCDTSANFGDHRHHGSQDIMVLVCHVILQDHETKRSCKFKDEGPSR